MGRSQLAGGIEGAEISSYLPYAVFQMATEVFVKGMWLCQFEDCRRLTYSSYIDRDTREKYLTKLGPQGLGYDPIKIISDVRKIPKFAEDAASLTFLDLIERIVRRYYFPPDRADKARNWAYARYPKRVYNDTTQQSNAEGLTGYPPAKWIAKLFRGMEEDVDRIWSLRAALSEKLKRKLSFYASLLNNQPMGFYTPATIVKDAQRHGLKMKPVCISQSDWRCTVVDDKTVRLGFCVVSGLRQEHAEKLAKQRQDQSFKSLDDFKRRVALSKDELRVLAELGALNCLAEHRRAAMWQVEETLHNDLLNRVTPGSTGCQPIASGSLPGAPKDVRTGRMKRLFWRAAETSTPAASALQNLTSPLAPMTLPERVRADYEAMNLTTGPHPMKLLRKNLPNIWRATDLIHARDGSTIQIAGNVICRQRPGTAKGFVFISLEDETGVSNAIVDPDLFERFRLLITEEAFLLIQGQVQNSDGVVLIKAREIKPLVHESLVGSESHDFH